MAIKTPARPTEPARPLEQDRTRWETVETTAETASRAVRPPTVVEHRRLPEKDHGEARLVWRCDDCGELGSLTAFPSACPDCGAGREALFYSTED
ncbi:DUF7130 family rubredoxin-like protein [Haloferax denitrificans]|uniref:Small CPxCG-related zinc finger protein n=1 Tax=Haloferax denitrificans ATCC 35960 TaxID=662478 RepID=M0J7S3_9EURY|nr:hypothetical protein [Haloferax denitrificans]EMA05001.1 small CPxCG-related zinc finger protein [Haloferax denitrificans ATCC 35960]